jgi:hypothetical protein
MNLVCSLTFYLQKLQKSVGKINVSERQENIHVGRHETKLLVDNRKYHLMNQDFNNPSSMTIWKKNVSMAKSIHDSQNDQ